MWKYTNKGSDAVCDIVIPKSDEISLADIGTYTDRWFLGTAPCYNESGDVIGEVMYTPDLSHIFKMSLYRRSTIDSFTCIPAGELYNRAGTAMVETFNLLDAESAAEAIMNCAIKLNVYNSSQQYSKAKFEYFMDNAEIFGIDKFDDSVCTELFKELVHPIIQRNLESDDKYGDLLCRIADLPDEDVNITAVAASVPDECVPTVECK